MGRGNLSHINKGVIYVPSDGSESASDIARRYKHTGKTIVIFRSGKDDMKSVLKKLIKTRLNA